ncbi:MAG: ABC transporter substrate-binding protein [Chloroflexota bacterium]
MSIVENGVSGVRCQVLGVRCQVSGARCSLYHSLTPSLRTPLRLFLFTIHLLLITFLSACYSVDPVVKIALVAPFEGSHRAVGYDVIYSARLAVRELNEQGGIGGNRVALVAWDDGGNVELARETAVSIINDPAIVAVVGHWQPETTAAVTDLYAEAGLLFIPMDGDTAGAVMPDELPAAFVQNYEAVTPFDETTDIYAGSAYDAFQFVWLGLETAVEANTPITRDTLLSSTSGLEYLGISGLEIELGE